jgi:hypothetical protein
LPDQKRTMAAAYRPGGTDATADTGRRGQTSYLTQFRRRPQPTGTAPKRRDAEGSEGQAFPGARGAGDGGTASRAPRPGGACAGRRNSRRHRRGRGERRIRHARLRSPPTRPPQWRSKAKKSNYRAAGRPVRATATSLTQHGTVRVEKPRRNKMDDLLRGEIGKGANLPIDQRLTPPRLHATRQNELFFGIATSPRNSTFARPTFRRV